MGNYNHHNKSGSRGGYGHREEKEMHQAVCVSCGKNCLLPFEPNGRKPVYCSDCFRKNGGGADSRRPSFNRRPDYGNRPDFERRNDSRPQNNEQFIAINRKLDKIIEMLTVKTIKNATPIKTD